jgi:hypothetical protein
MWTYQPSQILTTPLYQVRFLLGDTDGNGQQVQDEEISFSLLTIGSVWGAAAICCRALAAKMSRLADQASGTSTINYSQRAKAYAQRAVEYDAILAERGTTPYSGGMSVADMQNFAMNSDLVQPIFEIGMMDNDNYPTGEIQPGQDSGFLGGGGVLTPGPE